MARPGNSQYTLQWQKMLKLFLLPRYSEFNSSKKKKKTKRHTPALWRELPPECTHKIAKLTQPSCQMGPPNPCEMTGGGEGDSDLGLDLMWME